MIKQPLYTKERPGPRPPAKRTQLFSSIFQWAMVVILILVQLFRKPIQLNEGLGWDGLRYAPMAANLGSLISHPPAYQRMDFIRLLPSLLVGWPLSLLDGEISSAAIVMGFKVLNSLCVVLAWFFFLGIAKHLKLSQKGQVLAFSLCFLNFSFFFDYPYHPVQTDPVAFVLGLASYFFYLKNSRALLALSTFLCGFCWPAGFMTGLLLIIFPAGWRIKVRDKRVLVTGLMLSGLITYTFLFWKWGLAETTGEKGLLCLSGLMVLTYVCFVLFRFAQAFKSDAGLRSSFEPVLRGIFIATVVYVARSKLVMVFSHPYPDSKIYSWFFHQFFMVGIAHPGHFLAGLMISVGPPAAWLLVSSKEVFERCNKIGFGLQLVCLLTLLYSCHGEWRHLTYHLPFFLILSVAVFNKRIAGWKVVWSLVSLQIVFSRFWLKLDIPWKMNDDYSRWPEQLYLMNYPPWLNQEMSAVGLVGFLVCLWLMIRLRERLKVQAE